MVIRKFTKLKDGMYQLTIDDIPDLILHEDLILKFNLLKTKNIEIETIRVIKEQNKTYEAYNCAIHYIGKKIRNVKETKEYLLKNHHAESDIKKAIVLLKKQGYLSNDQYARAFILDKINMSSDGPLKIKQDLLNKEIESHIVEHNLALYTEKIECEKIKKLILKQLKTNHTQSKVALKRKIYVRLMRLGYHPMLVEHYMKKVKVDDQDIYQKEYQKIYDKLSKKYTGKELEFRVKQKMYQKGFTQNSYDLENNY